MTVKELREALKGVKPDVEVRVAMPHNKGISLITVKSIKKDDQLGMLRFNI